jgi:hypothetical protein
VRRICLSHSLHPWTWTTIATRRLPSCVSPSLDYYHLGSRAPLEPSPEGLVNKFQALSIRRFVMGGSSPVPEYQPDVHRLRLSASP